MAHALQQRARYAARRWERAWGAGALIILLLFLLLGVRQYRQMQEARTEARLLQHYLNGVWAMEVKRWDRAAAEFEAAGTFRDAPDRLAQSREQLNQVEARYEEALALAHEGHPWDAAYLLNQVVAVLPDYREALPLLERMRGQLGPIVLARHDTALPLQDSTSLLLATAALGQEFPLAEGVTIAVDAVFSPDGAHLLYEVLDDGLSALWLVEVASGRQRVLAERAQDIWAWWSPDSQQVLYGFEGEGGWSVLLRTLASGAERPLIQGADLATGGFSPRGGWVTLWERRSNEWRLHRMETANASQPVTLVERADSIGLQEWSEDEQQLAYGFLLNGQWRLYLSSPADATAQEIAPGTDYAWVRFRPRYEGWVLWQSQAQLGRLLLRSPYPPGERDLLRGPLNAWARWSPDGRWLATSGWNGRTWQLELWQVSESGQLVESAPLASEVEEWEVLFSPDSRRLLVRTFRGGRWAISVRDVDTLDERLLLADATVAQGHWTPDGSHVLLWWAAAEASQAAPTHGTLAVAEAATGRRITLRQQVSAVQGSFSRDGSKVGLAMQQAGGASSAWVLDPDGSDLLELDRNTYQLVWASAPFHFGPRTRMPVRP